MKKIIIVIISFLTLSCADNIENKKLAKEIKGNREFKFVKNKAIQIVKTGFNAGDGYDEVWIRDYNTFIELSAEVFGDKRLEENLLVFFRLQREDGNIIDGFIPKEQAKQSKVGYKYIYSELEPNYCGHKNTVETDHESSLVQAVYKYIKKTGNSEFLEVKVGSYTVAERMEMSMQYLIDYR